MSFGIGMKKRLNRMVVQAASDPDSLGLSLRHEVESAFGRYTRWGGYCRQRGGLPMAKGRIKLRSVVKRGTQLPTGKAWRLVRHKKGKHKGDIGFKAALLKTFRSAG